ncbi:MAG: hypothetical protein PWP23_1074 [Candidatus Sumerlaeota bacterium]|nr:hypothetical protein [Candidatus Sumerlaeota bacterium]
MHPMSEAALPVLHVVASINRLTGGPAVSVPELASALRRQEVAPVILALDLPGQGPAANPPGVPIHLVAPGAFSLRGFSPALCRAMRPLCTRPVRLVHNHGLWMGPNVEARRLAGKRRVPLVISPRGMVEQWSLGHHGARKRLAWLLYEKSNFTHAAAFHATSAGEARSIRRLGFRQPIAVIPNGVRLPDVGAQSDRRLLEKRFPALAGKRVVLFLSRLHPKKGVAELLAVWSRLAEAHSSWHLLVAGTGAREFGERLESQAAPLIDAGRVTFAGHLDGAAKVAALEHAELFVLPSYSENFGMAVAEALAHGLPCIVTTATPWSSVAESGAGWCIETGEAPLEEALQEALREPGESLHERGARGRDLVAREYGWDAAAREMAMFYRWILGEGPEPSSLWRE